MVGSFKQYYKSNGKGDTVKDKVLKEKEVPLLYHELIVQAQKIVMADTTGIATGEMISYRLAIKSKIDPLLSGFITYPNQDDLMLAFDNFQGLGLITDFMQRNSREFVTATKWMTIVADEVKANTQIRMTGQLDKDKINISLLPKSYLDAMADMLSEKEPPISVQQSLMVQQRAKEAKDALKEYKKQQDAAEKQRQKDKNDKLKAARKDRQSQRMAPPSQKSKTDDK